MLILPRNIDHTSLQHKMPETLFVGPRVPDHIQLLRRERRKTQSGVNLSKADDSEAGAITLLNPQPEPSKEEPDDESSDDDGFGPQLPTSTADDEEAAALARLQSRASAAGKETESALGPDRSNWLASALGAGNSGEKEVSYNPKTFRRNISVTMDKSWTETHKERSKREADAMMGLSAKKAKVDEASDRKISTADNSEQSLPSNERENLPSLLEEHQGRRIAEKEIEDTGVEGSFNWERDVQGKGRGAGNKRVAEFVNQAKSMNDRFSRASK